MPKFFVTPDAVRSGLIRLSGQDSAHLKALRLRDGEELTVCDGEGKEYTCVFRGMEGGEGLAEILHSAGSAAEPALRVWIYAAMPKGDKTETIVQKSVELGAAGIAFFLSRRSISRPDPAAVNKRMDRLSRVAAEAAMQSGRGRIPKVTWLPDFSAMTRAAAESDLALFLWEEERTVSLRRALTDRPGMRSCAVVTGPEGGFCQEEAAQAQEAGLVSVSLGRRILRCETAPLCALSAVMYHAGELE